MQKPMIYIIEKNSNYRKVIKNYLAAFDFDVKTFSSPDECLENISEYPDVIVLDFFFGDNTISGFDFMKYYKKRNPTTRFIYLSSNNDINLALDTLKLGATDYIVKDIYAPDKLVQRILRLIEAKKVLKKAIRKQNTVLALLGLSIFVFITSIIFYTI